MANDFFSPLLYDVYGLFGAAHAPTENPGPPPELEEGPTPAELQQLMRLDVSMRERTMGFLKTARRAGHSIDLLPAAIGIDQPFETAPDSMTEGTIHEKLSVLAERLNKFEAADVHHMLGDAKPPALTLLFYIRVAYTDECRRTIPKRQVKASRWADLARIGQRAGMRAGFFMPHVDVAFFQHLRAQPLPTKDDGVDSKLSFKKTPGLELGLIVDAAIALIREFEACELTAYPDQLTGDLPWRIGYGATGPTIDQGTNWTAVKANSDLKDRVGKYAANIQKMVEVPLSNNSFAALVSLGYSIGIPALKKSKLLKKLNKKDYHAAGEEFLNWVKAGGKIVANLEKRREAELKLFLDPPAPGSAAKSTAGKSTKSKSTTAQKK